MTTLRPSPPNDWQQMELPSMSSAEASPARTSASQDWALVWTEPGQVSGPNTPVLLANFDPASYSWRTSQRSLLEGWTVFSETWPRSGMMRSGIAFLLLPLVPLTVGTDSGSWPTPTASGFEVADIDALLERRARMKAKHGNGNGFGLTLNQAVKVWPTPKARDWKDGRSAGHFNRSSPDLGKVVGQSPDTGSLNPTWVEWLMGFPLGWTDLRPSETP
jgi:hypothetical protein